MEQGPAKNLQSHFGNNGNYSISSDPHHDISILHVFRRVMTHYVGILSGISSEGTCNPGGF